MPMTDRHDWLYRCQSLVEPMQDHDWATTPIGARETWSFHLEAAIANLLSNPLPILLAWGDGKYAFWNEAWESYDDDRFLKLGHPVERWIAGVDFETERRLQAAENAAAHGDGAIVRICERGGIQPNEALIVPVFAANGRVSGVQLTVLHRDAPVRSRRQIEESEERLRSALAVGRIGLWDWDITNDRVHWSDEHFRMEGYAVGEIEPSYEAWSNRLHPDDRERAERTLHTAMEKAVPFVCEFRVVHPGGSVHWLSARGEFSYDETGRAIRMIGAMIETTDHRRLEERQAVLLAELQHRVRNLIGLIQSLARSTSSSCESVEDYVDHFVGRLQALGRTQVVLAREPGAKADLEQLVRDELLAHAATDREVCLEGPRIELSPKSTEILMLAVHELATNSVKYGALGAGGALAIEWTTESRADRQWLIFVWRETCQVSADNLRRGFGSDLIERRVPYELGGEGRLEITSDGVVARIAFALQNTGSIFETNAETSLG